MTDRTVVLYLESREIGGTELALLHLAAALRSVPGWRPMICHHDRPELRPVIERARSIGIDVLTLPSLEGPLPAAVIRLARAIGQIEPDVFHAHLPWPAACRRGLFAATVARVPAVVATAHLYLPVADLLNRAAVRLTRVDRYVAVSEAVAHGLWDLGIDRRRIRVIHNAGAAALDGGKVIPERRPPDGRPTIAAVGRLTEQKGYPVLLEALAGLPDVSLLVAGDGPLRPKLEEMVRRLDLADRVEFLGNVDDVTAVLARAHLFVLTSLNEGLPLVVVEAMRAGLPVVATRVGGTPEAVIEGETGLLVDPGDVTGTRMAISRLLEDLDLAERLGRRGQQVAQAQFSVDGMVNGVVDVYEELLAGAADSPRPWRRRPNRAMQLPSGVDAYRDPLVTEASRNAVLRRADWRFLLPDPSPKRTACYCDGQLLRATRAISGEILFPPDRPQESDLAVVANPDPATLKAASQALRPGGICYSEWHGLRPMTRGGVARRLNEAGFTEIRTYWP